VTIALQYLSDLSRVRISLSDLPDGTVQVQRALNPAATDAIWEQGVVRGGRALPVSGGVAVLDDYEFHADTENHYRVVPADPGPGLFARGQSGAYASTPDHASLDITGDIWLAAEATPDGGWAPGAAMALVGKYSTGDNQRSYLLSVRGDGTLRLNWSENGSTARAANSSIPIPTDDADATGRMAVAAHLDVNFGGGTRVTFYTAPTLAGPWTAFGDPADAEGTTSIFAGSAELAVGAFSGGAQENFAGVLHAAEVRSGDADGTVVANPDFSAQVGGTTSFADSAGRTWTVHGDARIIGVEVASITPSLDGRVWLKSVRYPGLNQPVTPAEYGDVGHSDRSGAFAVSGASLPLAVTDHAGGRDHPLILVTRDQAAEDKLRVLLRLGGVIFVHVPASPPAGLDGNRLLPGSMYAVARGWSVRRAGGVSDVQLFNLPLQEVRKPAPDVVGTTLTVGQLIAQHDSIESVWAAYPSIRNMWDDIGDINDLVVI